MGDFHPSGRIGKQFIISIIISFELSSEIFKREETMRGIKAFVILAMTAFYFPIVSWGKGTNLFVLDA